MKPDSVGQEVVTAGRSFEVPPWSGSSRLERGGLGDRRLSAPVRAFQQRLTWPAFGSRRLEGDPSGPRSVSRLGAHGRLRFLFRPGLPEAPAQRRRSGRRAKPGGRSRSWLSPGPLVPMPPVDAPCHRGPLEVGSRGLACGAMFVFESGPARPASLPARAELPRGRQEDVEDPPRCGRSTRHNRALIPFQVAALLGGGSKFVLVAGRPDWARPSGGPICAFSAPPAGGRDPK